MRTHKCAHAQELRLERLEAQLALMKQAADHGPGGLANPALAFASASASAALAQHHRARSAGNPGAAASHESEYRGVSGGGHRGADEGVQDRGAGREDDEEVGGWISPRHAAAPYRASEARGSEGNRGGADVLTLGSDVEDDEDGAESGDEDEADEAMRSFAEPQIRVHIVEKHTRKGPAAVQPAAARGDAQGAARRQPAPHARASAERPAAPDAAQSLSQGEGRRGDLGKRHALPCSPVPVTMLASARGLLCAACSSRAQLLPFTNAGVVPLHVTLCIHMIIIFHTTCLPHWPQCSFAALACALPHGACHNGMLVRRD